jgi:hypothetical protein
MREIASRAISKTRAAFRECIRAWWVRQWYWAIRMSLRGGSSRECGRRPCRSDADAAVLFTYLRSSFGNAAPPVDADTVSQALGASP